MEETKIKICGLFRDCDITYVNECQPDYAGFVFYPPSSRYVTKEQVQKFREKLSPKVRAVGVFVDVPEEQVAEYLMEDVIQVAQLHGNESEPYMKKIRKMVPGCEIWKAFRIWEHADIRRVLESSADRILLDNGYGTGQCFDWRLVQEQELSRPFLLAGGLVIENIESAMEYFHPWGVDISSGVETDGVKDLEKICKVIEKVRRRQ